MRGWVKNISKSIYRKVRKGIAVFIFLLITRVAFLFLDKKLRSKVFAQYFKIP